MPETLNPTADDQYVASNQRRSDVATVQNSIVQIEAMKPDEKKAALANNGFDAGRWAQLKQSVAYPLNEDDHAALEAQRQQVEGGKPAPSSAASPAPAEGSVAGDLNQRWLNFWKEAGVKEGEQIPDPSDPDFDAKMSKLSTGLINSVAASQPDVAVQGGESSGIVSQLIDRIKKHFGPEGAKAVDAAANRAPDAANVAADALPDEGGGGEGNQPGASAAEAASALAPKPGEAATGEFAGNVEQGSIAKSFNSRQEAMEAAVKSGGTVSKTRNAAGFWTVDEAGKEGGAGGATGVAQPEGAPGLRTPEALVESQSPEAAPAAHSDIAAIQQAAAQPMSKDEFEKIGFTGDAEHPDLTSPLLWTDRFRAMEYGGDLANNAVLARKQFLTSGSDADKAAIEAADKEMNDALPRAYAIRHETGLALQKLGASPGAMQLKAVFEAMAENVGMPVRLSSALAKLPTIEQRAKLLDDAAGMSGDGWTAKGALYKLYVNSILSFNSVGKKAVSDAANILFQVPARELAAGISNTANMFGSDFFKGASGESIDAGEAHAMARGMIENFGSALKTGLDSAREGKPMFEGDVGFLDNPSGAVGDSLMGGSGYEGTWWGRAIDYYGHLVSVPGRAIIGVDQFSKSMQFNMEIEALAHRQGMAEAAGEGLSGTEQAARAEELANGYLKKTPGWMNDQAMQTAKINTFQQDLEGQLAGFDAIRKKSFLLRTLAPFFKTPVNITLQGIRQSPLAPMSGVWRRTVAGGGPEAAIALSKTALGSAIGAYLTYHVLKGNITGGIPANLKGTMRDDWLKDHEPYSIKSGDGSYHSYQLFEPAAWLLGMVADAAPSWAYMDSATADHAHGSLAQAVVNEINRQPMWGALHMLVHALDDVDKGRSNASSIGEVGSRMVAGLIPSMAANLAGGIDPVRRQTEGVFQDIRNRIPFLKEDGLASLDSFGRPAIVAPGFMANEFPAYVSTTKKPDSVVDEMIRLKNAVGFEPPQIPPSIGPHITADAEDQNAEDAKYGAKLSPAEQNRWNELRNEPRKGMPTLYDSLAKRIEEPSYLAQSNAQQATEWHQRFTGYQQMGHDALLNESEGVRGRMMAAYVGKGKARTQGRPGGVASIGLP